SLAGGGDVWFVERVVVVLMVAWRWSCRRVAAEREGVARGGDSSGGCHGGRRRDGGEWRRVV
ncbi:hypothetical protein Tco_0249014, partial [Tanacetum coccineum]